MAGYDSRLGSGFLGLGYDYFPFAAYDGGGRLVIPTDVHYPEHVKEGVGRVVQTPIWSSMYRTLSVLDDPSWNVFSAAIGFSGRTVNVAIFKSMASVPDIAAAQQWTWSYTTTVARTVRQFAGAQYLVDPAWVAAANAALDNLPQSQKQNDPANGTQKPGQGQPLPTNKRGRTPAPGLPGSPLPIISDLAGEDLAGTAFVPYLLMGLRSILGLLEKYTPKPEVRTTVWWYPGPNQQVTNQMLGAFTPMHTDFRYDGALRTVCGVWNPRVPSFHYSTAVKWSQWGWSMPHEPWQWCRAFNPIGNCGGPGLWPGVAEMAGGVDPDPLLEIPEGTDGVAWDPGIELARFGGAGFDGSR